MQIIQAPHPVLSEKAKPIKKIDKDIIRLIDDMKATLLAARDPEGVGLAAPQVGYGLQLFIIKPSPKAAVSVYINPKLTLIDKEIKLPKDKEKLKKGIQLEGCLSLKDIWGTVARSNKVLYSYTDERGKTHEKEVSGFTSIILQHEYDHLQGILFPRRVLEQKGQLYKSHKNEQGEDEFEEIDL